MLDLKQLNQEVGEQQLKQLKVNAEHEKRISSLLKRVHTLEEARTIQITINKQLLNPEKKSIWDFLKF